MTDMLEKAIARAKQLPEEQQDAIAALILEEIEDEHAGMPLSHAHMTCSNGLPQKPKRKTARG